VLRVWLAERAGHPDDPLFPTIRGRRLTRDALERRLALHVTHATNQQPSLKDKIVTLHTLRHYVDGWVMWPAGVFTLLGLSPGPVPAT
jgi:integrase